MSAKRPVHDAIVVAAGHQQRLEQLKVGLEQVAESGGGLLAEIDALLGDVAPFEGDPDQLRRDVDAALGLKKPSMALIGPTAVAEPLRWDDVVAANADVVRAAGGNPEGVRIESLLDAATLSRLDQEWADFSASIDTKLDEAAMDALISSCKRTVLASIITPLGLGRLVAKLDHVGGSVLTHHNAEAARTGTLNHDGLADANRSRAYAERQDRSEDPERSRHGSSHFRGARTRGGQEDAYRDSPLVEPELDHVVAASRLDRDQRINFNLDEQAKDALINDEKNLAWTNRGVNRSKGSADASEWAERQRSDGTTNGEHWGINREKLDERITRAEAHVESTIRSAETRRQLKEAAKAGASDALRMGLQQAVGAVLVELVVGLFDEAADLWRHGRNSPSLLDDFVVRAKRVGERVLASWRDVIDAFKQGALAGLLSTIVTAVINSVITTGKRAVRLIREGVLSLLRAARLLASPPPGMDTMQASHEASKLLAAAVAVSVGIAVEETIEKALIAALPVLTPVAPLITIVVVGLASGLSSVLLAAYLDRVDFFGAVARERGNKRLEAMQNRTDQLLSELLKA